MEGIMKNQTIGLVELDEEELIAVEGGGLGAGAIIAGAALAYQVGKDLGRELYHWMKD